MYTMILFQNMSCPKMTSAQPAEVLYMPQSSAIHIIHLLYSIMQQKIKLTFCQWLFRMLHCKRCRRSEGFAMAMRTHLKSVSTAVRLSFSSLEDAPEAFDIAHCLDSKCKWFVPPWPVKGVKASILGQSLPTDAHDPPAFRWLWDRKNTYIHLIWAYCQCHRTYRILMHSVGLNCAYLDHLASEIKCSIKIL